MLTAPISPSVLMNANTTSDYIHAREREQKAHLRLYFFGQFRLLQKDQPLEQAVWRRNKAKSLLKWFIFHPNELCSADQLITLFWPEMSIETAYSNFHVTIHYLRRLLEPALARGQNSSFIHRHASNFYQIHLDESWWADILEVQSLFESARRLDGRCEYTKSAFCYRKIASYCEKGFLPEDIYEDAFQPYRRHYECLYLQTLLRLIEIGQQRNEHYDVLEYAYMALHTDPYYEPAVKAIAAVYLEQGNVSGALRTLNEFQRFLGAEMGIEPSREIMALREKITSDYL